MLLAAANDGCLVGNGLKRCVNIFFIQAHWCFFLDNPLGQCKRHTWNKDTLSIHLQSWAERSSVLPSFPCLHDFCTVPVQPGLWLLKENLVHACSEQDITTHKTKCWLWLRPSSWSSVSAGDRRYEEEKPLVLAGVRKVAVGKFMLA